MDVGAWGAIGLRDSTKLTAEYPGVATILTRNRFADRAAGYVSYDLNDKGSQVIVSAGWQEGPGNFFTEADGFFRVRPNTNLFAGIGYGSGGSFDAVGGVEFMFGKDKRQRAVRAVATEDECGCPSCTPVLCDDDACAPRYRGGWANGVYRSALRVVTPSRLRRDLAEPSQIVLPPPDAPVVVQPPATPPIIVTPPPRTITTPPPLVVTPPPVTRPVVVTPPPTSTPPVVVTPPPTKPPVVTPPANDCPPRLPGHHVVEGRFSEWLKAHNLTLP
jgi:hypothetical protein